MAPKPAAANTKPAQSGVAGIINVDPAALQHQPAAKAIARLKVVIRRLPPGLTEAEFHAVLGEEWAVGAGRVDWARYWPGKLRSAGKHPDQARAYLHLTNESHLAPLEAHFLAAAFHDEKGTHRIAELKHLPPVLEFAPCQRIPVKNRQDTRQGTIDQDPEYMSFLESETQALPKPPSLEATTSERIKEIVGTTPLIDALRERKAAKAKAAAAKAAVKQGRDEADTSDRAKTQATKSRREAASVAKPPAKADAKSKATPKTVTKIETPAKSKEVSRPQSETLSPTPAKKRERAPASIKSMLERDLGLAKPARRQRDSAAAEKTKAATDEKSVATAAPPAPTGRGGRARPSQSPEKGKALAKDSPVPASQPVSASESTTQPAKQKPNASPASGATTKSAPTSTASQPKPQPNSARSTQKAPAKPTQGSTKAYLKHANASQGITQELLHTALANFGEVVAVDIDKRKGTAIAEFKSVVGLAAAIAKRNIAVAEGAVEVLEFREKSGGKGGSAAPGGGGGAAPTPAGTGGGGGGRGRGQGRARGAGSGGRNASTQVAAGQPAGTSSGTAPG